MADNGFTPQAVPPGGLGSPPAAGARPLNLFSVPATLAKETGVLQIGLVALTPQEEMDGFQRAGGAGRPAALAAQQVMTSLREITTAKAGRQALSLTDGTADSFWSQADPRIRNLAMLAFADVHHVKEEDEASFLQSRQVRVG